VGSKTATNKKYLAALALIAVAVFAYYASTRVSYSVNSIHAEVGIVKADGTIIPLNVQYGQTLDTFTVNGVPVSTSDWIYMKAWVDLKASGTSGNVTSVQFQYYQYWQGTLETNVIYGTTGPMGTPKVTTSQTESWLKVSLPQDTTVRLPLKYRDIVVTSEGEPTTPMPYSTYDSANNQMIREARLFKVGYLDMPTEGTYTMQMYCKVYAINWQYGSHTGTATISPDTYQVTFTITRTITGTLTASVSGTASH
jgi:hypothetical protein